MSNDECLKNDEIRMTGSGTAPCELRHSSFLRHSSLDIATASSGTETCRVIVDHEPGSGAWNMAVDETLLDSAVAGTCSVRWYRWERATLSLGYFQSPEDALADPKL